MVSELSPLSSTHTSLQSVPPSVRLVRTVERSAADAWEQFVRGRVQLVAARASVDRLSLRARITACHVPPQAVPSDVETSMLNRVFCGEQQKGVAYELAISVSTASHRFVSALRKLGLEACPVPMPLVVAAQLWNQVSVAPGAVCTGFEDEAGSGFVLSVPRPEMHKIAAITPSEREVASLFMEGFSRSEIAARRGTSTNTVARQIHSIFSALRIVGRFALIRTAAALDCFA
jgi:DNA-binding NarL/FixJ family response regulator